MSNDNNEKRTCQNCLHLSNGGFCAREDWSGTCGPRGLFWEPKAEPPAPVSSQEQPRLQHGEVQALHGDGKAGGLDVTAERLYEMLVHGVATGSLVEANYCQRVISHLGGKEADRLRADNARLRTYIEQIDKKVSQIPVLLEELDRLREANETLVKENKKLRDALESRGVLHQPMRF